MQNKTAKQIQAELEFMRRSYQQRHDSLNSYLGEPHPLAVATPYIISASLVFGFIAFIITLFL